MKWEKIILLTILLWVVGTALIWLTCGWLFSWIYEIEPTSLWIPQEEMMSAEKQIPMTILSILLSFFFVLVYAIIKKGIPGKTGVCKGMTYGLLISLITAFGMATMPYYMVIAPGVVLYWILQALVANIIKGAILGAIYK